MDLRKMFLAGLAIATLASCNDDEKVQPDDLNGTKMVALSVEEGMKTKTPSDAITASDTVTFRTGHIYFANLRGQITDYYEISATEATNLDNKVINVMSIKNATAPIVFEVPEVSEYIYVFGNHSAEVGDLPKNGNMSNVTGKLEWIDTQTSSAGDVSNVFLFGQGDIEENPGTSGSDYKAYVEVAPIAARLELGKLTSTSANIKEYKVEGVFINYFYAQAALDGTPNEDQFQPFTSVDDFIQNGESTDPWYSSAKSGIVHDWDGTTGIANVSSAGVASPVGGQVWAYNLFVGEEIPHIVIKLKGVEVVDSNGDPATGWEDLTKPYYITVRNYKDTQGDRLTEFNKGYVYNIGNINFTEEMLAEYPEIEDDIEVDVTIKILDWQLKSIEADFDEE